MERKRLFLLGGYDLEMREIRRLLEEYGAAPYPGGSADETLYCDRKLRWGARLSDYLDLLDFPGEIYGIELSEDVTPPANYTAIDHHGPLWCRPSALEQVAELLGVDLNRWRRLVAANDRGYIPAMKAMGATPEEIRRVRDADLEAQGVTDEEKRLAVTEARRAERKRGVWVVPTALEHSSALVDLLYEQNKIPAVVFDREKPSLSCYGDGILGLVDRFRDAIGEGLAWYGGNPPGYFGLASDYFDDHPLDETIERTIETLQEKPKMHSYHIFMLPFVTEGAEPEAGNSWREVPFAIEGEDAALRYNEYTYFHDFVRKALFGESKEKENKDKSRFIDLLHLAVSRLLFGESKEKENKDKPISRYFEHTKEKGEYIIEVRGQRYRLELDGITLRHFKYGVGVLSFHLVNRHYESLEDILRINDFGRRIFPQFLGNGLVESTIDELLACSLTLALEGEKPMEERFDHYRDIDKIAKQPHRFPRFVESLLNGIYGANDFTPLIDDRMYTICHYMNDALAQRLGSREEGKKDGLRYESDPDWYRFVFVDGGEATCQDPRMLGELLRQSTYPRWSGYGTLFGITRYSFTLLSSKSEFATNVLNGHIRTVYFQMATLVLAQRASILHYSNKITKLLSSGDEIDSAESARLYKDYIDFINRLYFREVTPQEQGIELYDMMQKQMRVEKELKELDGEIGELHGYNQMQNETQRNDRLELISKIGAVFLPPTLLAGMFGMNIIDFDQHNPAAATISVILILFTGLLGYFSISREALKKRRWVWVVTIFLLSILLILLYPYPNRDDKHPSDWCGLYTNGTKHADKK